MNVDLHGWIHRTRHRIIKRIVRNTLQITEKMDHSTLTFVNTKCFPHK